MTTETSISSISGGNLNPVNKGTASATNHVNKKLINSDKIENLQVFENCVDPIGGSVFEKVHKSKTAHVYNFVIIYK